MLKTVYGNALVLTRDHSIPYINPALAKKNTMVHVFLRSLMTYIF